MCKEGIKSVEKKECDRCSKKFKASELGERSDSIGLPMHVCWKCEEILEKELGDILGNNFGVCWE